MTELSRRAVLALAPLAALTPGSVRAQAAPATRRRGYVDGRYGQLHVTSTISAARVMRPSVFCLPMSPRSGRDFDELALELAEGRDVHCIDPPGFGGSDAPSAAPSMEQYAAALIDGIRALGYSARRPVDLVGQHTGAAMAIEIACQQPRLVRRIVTIGVPLWGADEAARLSAEFAVPRPYFEDDEFLCKAWRRDLAALAGGLTQERMLLRFTEIMRAGLTSWWGFRAVFAYPMRERLPMISAPFLAIVLNESLAGSSREAARLVRRGRSLELQDLSGAALDFAAARLAAATREFLEQP